MDEHDNTATTTTRQISRRTAMRSGGALAGMAALVGAGGSAARASQNQETLELDVALDGRTWRMNRLSEIGPPLMGDTFITLGSIYPGGAFDDGVTGPDDPGAIGRWICQGTFIVDVASGDVPHVLSTQHFVFGDDLSSSTGQPNTAADALVSIGVEGGVEETLRTVSGGFGRYAGASGSVHQAWVGSNETLMQVAPGTIMPAFNNHFVFTFAE